MKAWLRICGLLAIGAAAVAWGAGVAPDLGGQPLAWQRDAWMGRPWTLWTSAWVHASGGSLVGNVLAMGALSVLGAWLGLGAAAATALYVAWPLSTLGLLLWPEVTAYGGLGAPIHAAAMILWAEMAWRSDAKAWSGAIFAGISIKLLAEHAWTQPVAFDPSWGANVVYAAHLTGAVAGAVCGLLAAGFSRFSRRPEKL